MVNLTQQSEAALIRLYKQAQYAKDDYTLERVDRAMDEIIRRNTPGLPERRIRGAMRNASKAMRARRQVFVTEYLEDLQEEVPAPGGEEDVIDLMDWVRRTRGISHHQRDLLRLLADGWGTADIAALYGVPVRRMCEQISRTRKTARLAYRREVIEG